MSCPAVVAGGWAVWRHGYAGRVTQDVDIVLPAERVDEFVRAASYAGFEVLRQVPGRWPKMRHKETDVQVDVLPEGERPGVPPDLAASRIPSLEAIGGTGTMLGYITLPALIELKLAAGRLKDKADVVALIGANPSVVDQIRDHLAGVHLSYAEEFDRLVDQARRDDVIR